MGIHRRVVAAAPALAGLLASCGLPTLRTNANARKGPVRSEAMFDHGAFDTLLRRHVDADGLVDYAGLAQDRAVLVGYLNSLTEVDPNLLASPEEQTAWWINAYNASVLFAILHWQPATMAELAGLGAAVTTRCGGHWWTLDEIRDRVLRKLGDPRVLLALCDGRRAGPRLRAEAYSSATIDAALDAQCRAFLADPRTARIDDAAQRVAVAPPLCTFAADFGAAPWFGLPAFIGRYSLPRAWMAGPFPVDELQVDAALHRR